MSIDPSKFQLHNLTDACSVWNLLSSLLLFSRSINGGCNFYCTVYVIYECLYKPRKDPTESDKQLIERLKDQRIKGNFNTYPLSIEDLQDYEILQRRKRLGAGEISSIAYAKKTGLVFLTDDQKARKFAIEILGGDFVQTVPHLVSWLCFSDIISEAEVDIIIAQHTEFRRQRRGNLEAFFIKAKDEALRCRLMAAQT
ncbi:MAG: hypothetical protein K9K65_11305 [Desulfarculaceae bacterium]|nr:hypothetical protein [Desulfarculaceae bacterium]MCF8121088.1 hypothetical protein [Desulfarculaceae bacterium]